MTDNEARERALAEWFIKHAVEIARARPGEQLVSQIEGAFRAGAAWGLAQGERERVALQQIYDLVETYGDEAGWATIHQIARAALGSAREGSGE